MSEARLDDIPMNEFVLPVVEAQHTAYGYAEIFRYRGTGFAIGSRGAVVTAAHVVSEPDKELAVVTGGHGTHRFWGLQGIELHDTEDVAVGLAAFGSDDVPRSPLRVSTTPQFGSAEWMVWGYPTDAMYDVVDESGRAVPRLELVYVRGYVRRQMPPKTVLPKIRGSKLYECDGLGGPGCSGAPMISRLIQGDNWPVIGVYLGERLSAIEGVAVSYATRLYELGDWAPGTLGRTLAEESWA